MEFTLEELVKLREMFSQSVFDYKDGFIYRLEVRAFGRNERPYEVNNAVIAEEHASYYKSGEEGMMTVYTNNPDFKIDDFGNDGVTIEKLS